MTAMTTIKEWQDRYLKLMTRVEEPVVRLAARASESIADYVPERPRWAMLEGAPTIGELVDNQLKFRRRVVDQQAAFVRKMLKAVDPALSRLDAKPVVKRPVAKRPAAKRAAMHRVA
jgi:hypothetical protein